MAIKMSFIGTLDSISFWIFSKTQISSQREVSILVCHTDLLNLRFDELSLLALWVFASLSLANGFLCLMEYCDFYEVKVTGQLIGLVSIGVTTHKI